MSGLLLALLIVGAVWGAVAAARARLNRLPSDEELAELCEDDHYFALGLAEVEDHLAKCQKLLTPAHEYELAMCDSCDMVVSIPHTCPNIAAKCGCASLGECCKTCCWGCGVHPYRKNAGI